MRVRLLDGGMVQRLFDRHMAIEFDKAARKPGLIGELDEPLAAHLLLDGGRMREQRFQVAMLAPYRAAAPARKTARVLRAAG